MITHIVTPRRRGVVTKVQPGKADHMKHWERLSSSMAAILRLTLSSLSVESMLEGMVYKLLKNNARCRR